MFYVCANIGDGYTEVGRYADLNEAVKYGDRIGTLFSDVPMKVYIRVSNVDESVLIEQEFYNTYVSNIKTVGV